MPVNLNALIRYKTIDACLRHKQSSCTIDFLIEKCSFALSESTGKTLSVSERTIRNDIRILRSDILGFNAPIIIKNGIYKYSKDNYSIFHTPFKELDLLIDIQDLLVEEFENIKNVNVKYLLSKIALITNKKLPEHINPPSKKNPHIFPKMVYPKYINSLNDYLRKKKIEDNKFYFFKKKERFLWGYILLAIDKTA